MATLVSVTFAAPSASRPQATSARPSTAARKALEGEPLLLGTAWYPEQWPRSRWVTDLALMQAAHIHVVRLAEFAWSTMEPSEGQYDFRWLDEAIEQAAHFGIKVVLGTPTAAPPAWLTAKYPDTLRVEEDGRRAEHGNRQQFSCTSPRYREFAVGIASAMAKRYGHNPNVLGWQIDNEIGAPTFDRFAVEQWHAWLAAKYGNIAALNRRWATAYWSQTYDRFDEVPFHSHNENPALLLDYKHFITDTWTSYVDAQVKAIRAVAAPSQFITTNTMHWNATYNHYVLHKGLDLAAWDDYMPDGHLDPVLNAASHDLVRGYKGENFWVMETQPAFVNWAPINAALPPGVTRAMAWQAIGHGADAVLYWQWRSAPNGQEQYHGTLLGANGQPVPVYNEVQRLGQDMDRVNTALARQNTTLAAFSPRADAAILQSYDSRWAIDFQKHTKEFDYVAQILDLYRSLAPAVDGGVSTFDMVSPVSDLSGYRIVFAPSLNVLTPEIARNLLDYVQAGGTLVLGPRSGMKDADNGLEPEGQPGPLQAALGAHVVQYYALDKPVSVAGEGVAHGEATVWAEQLEALAPDVHVLLTYAGSNGWLAGHPAAVSHRFGKGEMVYVGATLDVPTERRLLLPLVRASGVTPLVSGPPAGVELMQRVTAEGQRLWVLVNYTTQRQSVTLPLPGRDLLTGQTAEAFQMDAHGVVVWELAEQR